MTTMTTTCVTAAGGTPWSDAAVIATFLGAFVFVVAYAWTTRGGWRSNVVGVNVMILMASMTLVSALAVIGVFYGTAWPHREVIRTAAWGLIGVCVWWRVVILFLVQKR